MQTNIFLRMAQGTVKPVENGHYQKDQKLVFKTNYSLMQVKSIAEYFRPSLSYHVSLRSLFCLFLSGCFTQVLLHVIFNHIVGLFVFNIRSAVKLIWSRGHSLVSSNRLEKPGIEPAIPGLQGMMFIHTTLALSNHNEIISRRSFMLSYSFKANIEITSFMYNRYFIQHKRVKWPKIANLSSTAYCIGIC